MPRLRLDVALTLLVLAALKVVLVDFSGLGELGNIVAVIAAGLVFLGVAWLAPMPRPPCISGAIICE